MTRSSDSEPAAFALNRAPTWKVSPAGGKYYVNSVAVSADGSRVIGGTFFHHYGKSELRRAPGSAATPAPTTAPARATPSPEDGTFGVYCYNAAGQPEWKDEFAGWQGVYWVALSANGARAAAGGFISATAPQGFLRAYDATSGRLLLSRATQQRVNQVALSADGAWLISAAETLLLFRYDAVSGQYVPADEFTPEGNDGVVSAAISADGATVLYAGYSGHIGVFTNDAGKLQLRVRWKVPGGQSTDFCHMLELTPDGKSFVAGGANGTFYYSDVASFIAGGAPAYASSTNVRGAVYGVAIAGDGSLFAGVFNRGSAGDAWVNPRPGAGAGIARHFALEHNPNSAALHAGQRLFAVADGHPDGTPGCFYLFDTASGALRWQCPTGNMSWPITIAADGRAVVGGSDDSYLYYFAQ